MSTKISGFACAACALIVSLSFTSTAPAAGDGGFWLLTSWQTDFPVQRFGTDGSYQGEHIQTDAFGLGTTRAACLGPDDVFYLIQSEPGNAKNTTIQAYDATTGTHKYQLSGPGSGGYTYPIYDAAPAPAHGMKTSPSGDMLYLAHAGRIHRYDTTTGDYTPWINNMFYYSAPAWYDADGYYIDWRNFNAWDLVFPSENELLVVLRNSAVVLHCDVPNPIPTKELVPSGTGGLDRPRGLVIGPDGRLYVSSSDTDSILRYDLETGDFIDTFVPTGSGGLDEPARVIFGPDDNLYVVSQGTGKVLRYNGTTGAFIDEFITGPEVAAPYELIYVPEPTSLALVSLAGIALLRRHRHKCHP